MNYEECVDFFDQTASLGGKLGLEAIRLLLNKMSNPQEKIKTIHVGGTNGKGSVSNFIASILKESGYKIGVLNSPHILSYQEIISINHLPISKGDFTSIVTDLSRHCHELVLEGHPHPTLFECQTALAFEYFYREGVDFAIIEVGLGGRLDATNIISKPIMSILTSISLDHMEFLGSSIEQIAMEKSGIIKKNVPLVLAPNDEATVKVVFETAKSLDAAYYYIPLHEIDTKLHNYSLDGMQFSIKTRYFEYHNLFSPLIGNHQMINLSVVLTSLYVLHTHYDISISKEAIYKGIENTRWPLRCEHFKMDIPILIDGAHNEASMEAFLNVLKTYGVEKPITFLFGALQDKEVDKMLKKMSTLSQTIFLTEPISHRALSIDEHHKLAKAYFSDIHSFKDTELAFPAAFEYAKRTNTMLCCVGSFYLSGYFRNWLQKLL